MSKEYIYLSIIIISVLFKIIPVILQGQKVRKLLGYKLVKIKGLYFTIKKIDPMSFIEDDNGFCFTLVSYAKGKTMWEQMCSDDEKMSESDKKKRFELAKNICDKAVVYWPANLKVDDFFKYENEAKVLEICWSLYAQVLSHNLNIFRKQIKITKKYAIHVAELCAKFGTRPCDYIKSKGLTDIEKYMLDNFFYNVLLEKENSITEQHNRAIKPRKGRR